VKERPILFSAPMVRAILAGTKTQTRRILRDQQPVDLGACTNGEHLSKRPVHDNGKMVGHRMAIVRCPYGQPGLKLWVRETWQEFFDEEIPSDRTRAVRGRMGIPAKPDRLSYIGYRADGEMPDHPEHGRANWKPSIFMPRWASRITLEVTGVRVERLQDISHDDGEAEGCWRGRLDADGKQAAWGRLGFQHLWDSLNAKRAPWSTNPWVWVVEFAYLKGDEG